MKKLSFEEYDERMAAIQRASRIFIETGLTKNISVAFKVYQEVFAEREREIFLSTQVQGRKQPTIMDRYERPKCPDCGEYMAFRMVPENDAGIKVQLVCTNEKCDTVLNSDNDLSWWQANLLVKP
jgi:hypothetical protein